VMNANRHTMLK